MTYQRMTEAERTLIHRWNQEGLGNREIARLLDRAPSSIGVNLRATPGCWGAGQPIARSAPSTPRVTAQITPMSVWVHVHRFAAGSHRNHTGDQGDQGDRGDSANCL
jgi:hypothetical protein